MPFLSAFPATRYQGSKLKLLAWIWSALGHLDFKSCLDLFSGTASVSYLFKLQGKAVTSNDYLRFNQRIADALVVNNHETLSDDDLISVTLDQKRPYNDFITRTFGNIFFLDEENQWLDRVAQNIAALPDGHKKSLLLYALYQACLAKRPYNLFHRANLYMRTADVKRSFGNKATWEKSFDAHFREAAAQANGAIFSNGQTHRSLARDFRDVPSGFDLVYVDPPYINAKGTGVDYLDFYHFLEGVTDYEGWDKNVCLNYKHRPYNRRPSPWHEAKTIHGAFNEVLELHRTSTVVISYRSDGTPRPDEIVAILHNHNRKNLQTRDRSYKYVLSQGTGGKELLYVSEPPKMRPRSKAGLRTAHARVPPLEKIK